ncbi:MAG: diaminopimelate decarboxylase [Bernardetiaceae bacterium]
MLVLQEDGRYTIGGLDALDLCEQYGTPLYVYDAQKMAQQYRTLEKAFAGINFKIQYACKANTNLNIIRFFQQLGAGVDTVSIQEVQVALRAGYAPSDILYTPNCVSFEEIEKATRLGVRINIDNISILEQFGHSFGSQIPICLRINPHLFAGGHPEIQTGHIDSKFGVSIHQLRHVHRVIKANHIVVEGLHMHTGSDILDTQVFLNGLEILLQTAADFPDLRYIDSGSGFKVAYKPNDMVTNIEELGRSVVERFTRFCQEYGRELEFWVEPGKFMVSEAGHFLVRTNVLKQTVAATFVGVDSGMNHLLRPKLYDAYHHIHNISNPNGPQRVYTVVGYICETDTFGWDRKISEVREGDVLSIENAGAYAFAMSSNYNSRYRPAEVLILNGEAHLIRKRETIEDILRNQIEVPQLTAQPV